MTNLQNSVFQQYIPNENSLLLSAVLLIPGPVDGPACLPAAQVWTIHSGSISGFDLNMINNGSKMHNML